MAWATLGDGGKATDFFEESLAIAIKIGDRYGEARGGLGMTFALALLDRGMEAIASAEVALRFYDEIGHQGADEIRRRLAEWKTAVG